MCVTVSSGTRPRPVHTRTPSMSSVFARRCTCHTAPCNWMCWQHNDIGRWQKAAEREAERCLVRHTGDALVSEVLPYTSQRCQGVSKEEAMQYHSTLLLSVRSEMSLTV